MHNPLLGGNNNQIRDNAIYSNCFKMSRSRHPIYLFKSADNGRLGGRGDREAGGGLAEGGRQGRKRHPLQCCRLIIFHLDGRPRSTPG